MQEMGNDISGSGMQANNGFGILSFLCQLGWLITITYIVFFESIHWLASPACSLTI